MPKINNNMEQRTYNCSVEIRTENESQKIVGHAAVFDTIGDGGWFREKIASGAFTQAIERDDVRALFNHDPNIILGRNKAGTLVMHEDEKGLWVEIDPPNTQGARDVFENIRLGNVSQMSFGFEIIKEERQKGENGEPDLFILREVKLWDVSPVTFPFYKETDVTVQSRSALKDEQKRKPLSVSIEARMKWRRQSFSSKYRL